MICLFINTNPTSQKTSAVIVSETDNVNKFALLKTANIERHFRSEYLFRTSSVATNLVASVGFFPNCAVLLCRF